MLALGPALGEQIIYFFRARREIPRKNNVRTLAGWASAYARAKRRAPPTPEHHAPLVNVQMFPQFFDVLDELGSVVLDERSL